MRFLGYEIKKAKGEKVNLGKYSSIIDRWVAGAEQFDPKNPHSLIRAYAGWVYICADKNAKAVAKQKLRLYVAKPVGQESKVLTRELSVKEKDYIFENNSDQISKAYKQFNEKITVEEVLVHPFLDLMRKVNPFFNKTDFLYLSQLYEELTGNSYWGKARNGLGLPSQLWNLPSQNMKIIPSKENFIESYKYTNDDGESSIYNINDIVHHKFPYPGDLFYGMSPLSAVTKAVNISSSSNTYLNALYKNMGVIPGYFTTKENLGDREFERLDESLNKYRGVKAAGVTPLFDNSLEFKNVAVNPKDLFSAVASKVSREEIAAAFGVPLSLITVDDVNKANAEAGNRAYYRDTIQPRLKFLEEKMTEQICSEYDEKLFCAFDNPVKEDNEEVRLRHETDLKWGVRTHNEVRRDEGLSPVDGGDRRLIPMNYIYADRLDEYIDSNDKPKEENGQGGENTQR